MELPFGLVYSALPVGFLFLVIHLALFVRRFVADRAYDQDAQFDSGMSATL